MRERRGRREHDTGVHTTSAAQPESSLWRLVYVSDAKTPISDQELDDILQKARIRNFFGFNVTGMLMLVRGTFCQILEGSSKDVNELIEIIKRDRRHSNIRVLELKPIAERSFPDWTMGPPSRSLRDFSEASDVEEFFDSIRERTARPSSDVMSIMNQFHSGTLI